MRNEEFPTHRLLARSWRRGRTEIVDGRSRTVTRRFERGDLMSLNDREAEHLTRLGAAEEIDQSVDPEDLEPLSDPTQESERQEGTGTPPVSEGDPENPNTDDPGNPSLVEYDQMEYPALQDLARERGLPFQNVPKVKIIESLREYDAEHDDEDDDPDAVEQ